MDVVVEEVVEAEVEVGLPGGVGSYFYPIFVNYDNSNN